MELFVDTGSVEDVKQMVEMGLCDGITTNPSLISKQTKPFKEIIMEMIQIAGRPTSVEVTAEDTAGMIKQGRDFAEWSPHVVVKLPTTEAGVKACKALSTDGIKVNMTLCFQPVQALLVAKAGATYVSPFIGRLDDIGQIGMDVIAQIRTIYDNYSYGTKILAASIRSVEHVARAALEGSDVATIPFPIVQKLLKHPLTDKGLETFLSDWKKAKK
jgi:transaldolase